ncbi:MAG: ABC transporter ATP-binding protein [Candidatus Hodarchaeota archaeon]
MTETNTSPIILNCENVVGQFKGPFGIIQPVNGISLKVHLGDVVAIAGESGCGKSTFGELITGSPRKILHFISGSIKILDFDVYRTDPEIIRTEVKAKILGYVPQASLESLNPVKRIKHLILDVEKQRTGKIGNKNEVYQMARDHFKRLGLKGNIIDRYPHELSGGMKQRAVLAISTLYNPKLLIVDEPTSALDVSSQQLMIKMLYEMLEAKIIESILFISHDIATLRQICTKAIIMYAGEFVEEGSMDEVIENPLHPYTEALISSFVAFNPDNTRTKLKSIPGAPPDFRNPPQGCRYHPRCSKMMDICQSEEPPIFNLLEGRNVKCWLFKDKKV